MTTQINQTCLRGGQLYPTKLLQRVVRTIEGVAGKRSMNVSIAFVSAEEMKKANKQYRGKNRVTDVLSFLLEEDQGEILLSYQQARAQAAQMHHSVRDEITFLIVHGILHLFGYDHEKEQDAKKMFAVQERILLKLNVDPRLDV